MRTATPQSSTPAYFHCRVLTFEQNSQNFSSGSLPRIQFLFVSTIILQVTSPPEESQWLRSPSFTSITPTLHQIHNIDINSGQLSLAIPDTSRDGVDFEFFAKVLISF